MVKKIKISRLYKLANEARINALDENEIEKTDMTEEFLYELDQMIKKKEIIIININAKMRLGKSTLAMKLGKIIWELLQKHGYRKQTEKFGMHNIDRDQQEHSKRMRDPNTAFTVRVVDESNALENTGENVTVERALSQVFSDVQAGRYVHKVCCSPKEMVDPNADILLSVIGVDKQQKISHAKLYYRFYEGGDEHIMLLGYIRIYVGDIIKTWDEESQELFFKFDKRTKKEEERLQKLMKKDWYTEYMIKKYEKMDLITREGIFKPRVLDYAEIILNVTKRLSKLTKLTSIINPNIIRNYIKIECRKARIPMSIVGEELATREAQGLLDLYKAYHKLVKQATRLRETETTTDDEGDIELMQEDIQQIEDMKNEIAQMIEIQLEEYKRYAEIQKKYNTLEKREG